MQVVPQGIESIYGSDTTIGCTSPLVNRSGVWVCDDRSYLVDGCSPAININSSNWASQLVTARKTQVDRGLVTYDGVVLTFDFDTAVLPTSIELDIFLCSQWKSDAKDFYVYADENSNLIFNSDSTYVQSKRPPSPSCDSLSTVEITFVEEKHTDPSQSWHILVDINRNNEWAYVGEVKFFISNIINPGKYIHAICIPTWYVY